jgi:hypothetical protein
MFLCEFLQAMLVTWKPLQVFRQEDFFSLTDAVFYLDGAKFPQQSFLLAHTNLCEVVFYRWRSICL